MKQKLPLKYTTFTTALALLLMLGLGVIDDNQYTLAWTRPAVVGHRGSARGVENTLPALQHALSLGVDYIEVDVCLSADNVPVIYHDNTLSRLAGLQQMVSDLTAVQLQGITLRQNGYTGQIPTLQQVIDLCRGNAKLIIDIKCFGDTRGTMDAVGKLLTDNDFFGDCVVMSQHMKILTQFKKAYPAASIGYCRFDGDDGLSPQQLLACGIEFMVVEAKKASKELLESIQAVGLPVYICTVNSPHDMRKYFELGADGIVTDNPDAALSIIEQMKLEMQSGSVGATFCRPQTRINAL